MDGVGLEPDYSIEPPELTKDTEPHLERKPLIEPVLATIKDDKRKQQEKLLKKEVIISGSSDTLNLISSSAPTILDKIMQTILKTLVTLDKSFAKLFLQ